MKKLTDPRLRKLKADAVAAAAAKGDRAEVPLDGQGGMLVAQPSGKEPSIALRYRRPGTGKTAKLTYKGPPLTAAGVTAWLSARREEVARGADPGDAVREEKVAAQLAQKDSLRAVCGRYLTLQESRGLQRQIGAVRKNLERLVFCTDLAGKPVTEIRKSEFVALRDHVEEHRGPRMANVLRGNLATILKWHSQNSDTYLSPFPGIARCPEAGARPRILDDGEIAKVWAACEELGSYGQAVRLLLLTACRRGEVTGMRWSEINGGGADWVIPAARYKGKPGHRHDHLVPLSRAARAIVEAMPRESEFVFPNRDGGPLAEFSRRKAELDRLSGVVGWTIHDLRRTARSLMSRAGVSSDHAERCLGHVIGGVRGVYDRYEFRREKAEAFEALAGLIDRILHPVDNVTALRA
jgi:integrase